MNQSLLSKTLLFAFTLIASSTFIFSQNTIPLLFKSGTIEHSISKIDSKNNFLEAKQSNANDNFRIIQFAQMPSSETKLNLTQSGIELLNYLPKNAYYAKINPTASWDVLAAEHLKQVLKINPDYKLSTALSEKSYPDWALKNSHSITLNAVYFRTESKTDISAQLELVGATDITINDVKIANFTIRISELENLYKLPAFYYFETIDPPSEPENLVGATNHRSNTLATAYSNGLHLDGTGVTVMLQDNSRLDEHIDYTGRFINHASALNDGDHGEHVGGTIAGAGNIDPITRGMAYGAEVLVYSPTNANFNGVPNLVLNSNLTITSKSYSNGLNVGYTTLSSQLDQQTRNYPELIHVFSAGNSNGSGATSAGAQWFNITGGHKVAKNVLAVGNLTSTDGISGSSSRGPSQDGRIKPDICAVGTSVRSTIDPNSYGNKSGTSMACPGVAGTLAQLYQGYKELNNGNNPDAALIKGAILNTADDLGNSGPDFKYGWGRINARRAYDLISSGQYFTGDISQGDNLTHSIAVPGTGTAQLRVMLYWSDYEASASAGQVLVNDINMSISSPTGSQLLPWTLDNTPNATLLNNTAVPAIDNINNVEQITVDVPLGGLYTVNLDGFSIPQGPQKYFVVYELVTDDIVLTYPIGGESFDPNKSEIIRWDAIHDNGNFSLDYSTDNGLSWISINNNIQANRRYYSWNVPTLITGQAIMRISRGPSTSQSHEVFSIINVPVGLVVQSACADSVELSWNPVLNASGYEVSMLGNLYMDSIATASSNSLKIAHSSTDNFWWSVKALGPDNCVGRRAIAKYHSGGIFNCVYQTDAAIADYQAIDGRNILSCMESDTLDIGITIINSGLVPITNIPLNYKLNNSVSLPEIYAGTLAPNTSYYYSFNNQLSVPFGTNTLTIWADYPGDQNLDNDTVISVFNYLNAPPVPLPFFEDFETFSLCGTGSNCASEICQLSNNFVNGQNGIIDDIDWRTNAGPTPSGSTGPEVDFNPGTAAGKYLYLEPSATPLCTDKEAYLITPCIDLTEDAQLAFAYHMYGTHIGDLHLDILENGIWNNDVMPAITGEQGEEWLQATFNLDAYTGSVVNIRFRGVTGLNYRSDLAIDNISITSTLAIDDLQNKFCKLYPNPTKGELFYELNNVNQAEITVMNTNGQIVLSLQTNANNGAIDLSNVSAGIYFVKVMFDSQSSVEKIIIE